MPELEGQRLAAHRFIAVDRKEDLTGVGDIIKLDVRHTYALVAVERIDDVILVDVKGLIDIDLPAY